MSMCTAAAIPSSEPTSTGTSSPSSAAASASTDKDATPEVTPPLDPKKDFCESSIHEHSRLAAHRTLASQRKSDFSHARQSRSSTPTRARAQLTTTVMTTTTISNVRSSLSISWVLSTNLEALFRRSLPVRRRLKGPGTLSALQTLVPTLYLPPAQPTCRQSIASVLIDSRRGATSLLATGRLPGNA